MPHAHDDRFARQAIASKALSPAQIMSCRQALAEGDERTLAQVAVELRLLSADAARKIIRALNQAKAGSHPPLPLPQPAPAAKPARAPRPAAPKAKTPPPSRKGLLIGGAAAVVLLGGLAALFIGGAKPPAPPPKTPAPVPVAVAKPEPAPPAAPEAPRPPKPAPAVRTPDLPPAAVRTPEDAARAEFEARRAKKKQEAQERLEEVRKELEQERKEAAAAHEAFQKRIAGKTLTIAMKNGETVRNASVVRFTLHEADLEAADQPVRITWDNVRPESLPAAVALLFDVKNPADLFEKGRFYVARRLWKEAGEAFAAAAKLGQGFESRVSDFSDTLERLMGGQAGFRGAARRFGRDIVRLTWDFKNPKQLEDFTYGLVHQDGAAQLEATGPRPVWLWGRASADSGDAPMVFIGDVAADLRLVSDTTVVFLLPGGAGSGYELELAATGTTLFRVNPAAPEQERRRPAAKSDQLKLQPGKPMSLRLQARYPRFTLTAQGQPAFSAEEPPLPITQAPPAGPFGFRIEAGRLRIEAPLQIQGRMEPRELDRRMNDTEVMLRRALDPELEEIERRRAQRKARAILGEGEALVLSADDPYFNFRIKTNEDLASYEEMKKALDGGVDIDGPLTPEKWRKTVDALLAKHPDVPSLWYVRAAFRQSRMDPGGAKEDLKKALDLFPDFHEALVLAGELALDEYREEETLQLARRALEAKPDSVDGLVLRARAAFALNPAGLQVFMDDLSIARKLDPHDGEAMSHQRMLRVHTRGPRDLGCRFEHETAHYKISTDISAEAAKRYGENLEAAFRHYSETFHAPAPTSRKPRVAIFQTAENYYTYFELLSENRGEYTLGVFRPNLNELVLFEDSNFGGDSMHTLFHEAVHHFMTLVTPRDPPFWYNEGIAEYLGAIEVKDGKVTAKAQIQKARLQTIQLTIEVGSDYPFSKIMNETPREFYGPGSHIKYAQAWSMLHYFYEFEKGKHRGLIEKYFALLRAGKIPQEAYDEVFAAKAEELQKEWRTFVKGLK